MTVIVMDLESTEDKLLIQCEDELLKESVDSEKSEADVTADDNEEKESTEELIVSRRRWYILLLFSLFAFTQGGVWNTWGPLTNSVKVFNWSDTTIAFMNNWGCIAYFIGGPIFAWIMDVKGMRWASVSSAVLVVAGTGLRCITFSTTPFTWLTHIGQLLNGLGGPVAMAGPPALSAVWFPVHQRTSATAFATVMNGMGVAVAFILGPSMVEDCNKTLPSCNTTIVGGIRKYMYVEFGWSALICLLLIVYFPKLPPSPPSLTASIQRTNFMTGVKQLLRHKMFWVLGFVYAVPLGVMNAWSSVLDIILTPLGITEDTAGWIGFYCTVAGQVAGMSIGFFADLFSRRMRLFLLTSFSIATGAIIVFLLMFMHVIPQSLALVYITVILLGMTVGGTAPIFYELVCESTYPIAEGVTSSLLTLLNNVGTGIFFFVLMIPMNTSWMNWCLLGSTAVALPILAFYKEHYGRFDIDTHKIEVDSGAHDQTSNDGNQDHKRLLGDIIGGVENNGTTDELDDDGLRNVNS